MSAFIKFCVIFSSLWMVIYKCEAEAENHAEKLTESPLVGNVDYISPSSKGPNIYLAEHFDNVREFEKRWVVSKSKKPDVSEDLAQYNGLWELQPLEKFPLKGDQGLVLKTESRHAAIVAKFDEPFVFNGKKTFIVQYVVVFQKTIDCGGAYIKLLTDGSLNNLSLFNDKTPYTIMFGPDKCGSNSKMHFIIRHKNPINRTITEKHCTKLKVDDAMYKDREPYLLKLVIEPDNNFAVYINNELQYKGNLLDEGTFEPPINPPKEIVDENDVKPKDWDDRPKIPDPTAVKPDDWDEEEPAEIKDLNAVKPDGWLEDEPLTVPDKDASKPEDWDEDMDGQWEAPMIENPVCKDAPGCGPWSPPLIENPNFKGKWKPSMIDNPDYKGKWVPRMIPNSDYFYDETPLKSSPIGYIGFELWSLVNNMYFDDILVTDSETVANEWTERTWSLKKKSIEAESITIKGRVLKALNFKPGWWALYGIYCLIPITFYIYYMRIVIKKASFYKMFLDYTNTYPWLWAVYVLVLAVIVGLIGTCILRSRRNKEDFEKDLLHKKTDNYQPDDEFNLSNQPEIASTGAKITGDAASTTDYVEDEETDPEEKNSKSSSEDEEESAKTEEVEKEAVTSSPRKRRPRKD